jgi:hypothetical protein
MIGMLVLVIMLLILISSGCEKDHENNYDHKHEPNRRGQIRRKKRDSGVAFPGGNIFRISIS